MKKFTKKELCIAAISGAALIAVSISLLTNSISQSTSSDTAAVATVSDASAQSREAEPSEANEEEPFTGWKVEDGIQRYYENGRTVGNCWVGDYYLNSAHRLEKDVFVVWKGRLYHVDAHGRCSYGRFYEGEKEYFANQDGMIIHSTWVQDGDEWLYLSKDGSILKNDVTPDGYLMDARGVMIDDGYAEYEGFQYSDTNLRLNTGAADLIWKYLKKRGWTDTAIAGMLGNFQQESHLSPSLVESNGIGYGLGQWSFGRREGLETYARSLGKPVNDIYMQLDYLMVEPGESAYVRTYMKTDFSTAAEAAIAWCNNWERPNKAKARLASVRIPYAMAYYGHYVEGIKYMTAIYSMEDPVYADELEDEAETESPEAEYTPLVDENGNPTLGWIFDANGWWYRYPDGTNPKSEWKLIDDEWYYFGQDGYMESGQWITDNHGMNYQLDEEGHIIPNETEAETSAVITVGGAARNAEETAVASASDAQEETME